MRQVHIVGNWKMNQSVEEINTFFNELGDLKDIKCQAWIAPQAIHFGKLLDQKTVKVGAQNCAENDSGAFTGELSPKSIKDIGAHFVIIGHSERRSIYKETDALLNAKTHKALENDLQVIFCIGETLEQREAGQVEAVLKEQLTVGLKGLSSNHIGKIIVAYEPVWAIGTGVVATPEQAQDAHKFTREVLCEIEGFNAEETVILYGGSVKPANVEGLLEKADIDGALVGGASLKGQSFKDLCTSVK
jgi:triosephosphate isomerase